MTGQGTLIFADHSRFWVRRLFWATKGRNVRLATEFVAAAARQTPFLRAMEPGDPDEKIDFSTLGTVLIAHPLTLDQDMALARSRREYPGIKVKNARHGGGGELATAEWLLRGLARAGVQPSDGVSDLLAGIRDLHTGAFRRWTPNQTRAFVLAKIWAETSELTETPADPKVEGAFSKVRVARLPGKLKWFYSGRGRFSDAAEGIALVELENPAGKLPAKASLSTHGYFPTTDGKLDNFSAVVEAQGKTPLKKQNTALAVMTKADRADARLFVTAPPDRGAAIEALKAGVSHIAGIRIKHGTVLARDWLEADFANADHDLVKALVLQQFAFGATDVADKGLSLFLPFEVDIQPNIQDGGSKPSRTGPVPYNWPGETDKKETDTNMTLQMRRTLQHYFHRHLWHFLGIADNDGSSHGGPIKNPGPLDHQYRALCDATNRRSRGNQAGVAKLPTAADRQDRGNDCPRHGRARRAG